MTAEKKLAKRSRPEGAFRLLLLGGAVVSAALGVWGVVWTSMLSSVIGLEFVEGSGSVAGLYGGVMLAISLAYFLAAVQPQRSRSMLVVLLVVPLITAMVTIAGVSRDEITGGRGIGFALFELAYCLMYFRLYPRVGSSEGEADRAGRGES